MGDLVNVVARLRALQQGQAVAVAIQRQVAIQPHSLVVTLLAMAGEDTSVHAIAVGRFGEPASIDVVADPRRRDDQYALLRRQLPRFEAYYAECLAAGTFPQLWVSSAGAVNHIDTLADRLRFTEDPDMERLGTLWTYAGERSPVAGQQALISATGALRLHYATGQQEAEDEHLGSLLTWIEPPAGRDIFAAVAAAEAWPMGVKTDPWFDVRELQPAVEDFNKVRDSGDSALVAFHETRIRQLLESVIRPIYTATQRAISILSAERWRDNPAIDPLVAEETRAFADFMAARAAGYRLPYRDKPKSGAMKIVARERAVSNVDAGTLRHDRAAREKGVSSGRVLRATVAGIRPEHLGPRLFEYHMTLSSHQDSLHLRAGDELWTLDAPNLAVRIVRVERRGSLTWIDATVVSGKRIAKTMVAGGVLDLGPKTPNWGGIGFELGQMASRLAAPPWTHGETVPAAAPSPLQMPADLLAAVERLA
jgi:hypothetical protein